MQTHEKNLKNTKQTMRRQITIESKNTIFILKLL